MAASLTARLEAVKGCGAEIFSLFRSAERRPVDRHPPHRSSFEIGKTNDCNGFTRPDKTVKEHEALALLQAAVPDADGQVWADLGAGTGLFTRALAAMAGASGHVHAVDADAASLRVLRAWIASAGAANVTVAQADVSRPLTLPPLDGVLMANVLHFIPDQPAVLSLAASYLRPGGRLVLIEYEGRRPSPWVPHPVSIARFRELAPAAGLTTPQVVATRPSAFGGELYVARGERIG